MKGLIIAAGQGSRLRSVAESKPLLPVLGIPLIERIIGSAAEAGVDEFFVIIGYQGEKVRAALEQLTEKLGVPITAIENPEWQRANGRSVLKAKGHIDQPFILMMADHIFDPEIARRLIADPPAKGEVVLAVDRVVDNPMIDLDDVTRVKTADNRIQDIGKGMDDYDAFDTGLFCCQPALFDALEQASRESDDDSLSGGIKLLASQGRARVLPVDGLFWLDVDDEVAFAKAEKHLGAQVQD